MKGTVKIATAVTAAVAMLVLAGPALAQSGPAAQQSAAEMARGDALNKLYHLGKYSPAAQAGAKPTAMTTQQWRAELARGAALNERYGLGVYAASGTTSSVATSAPQPVVSVSDDGFAWDAAGIGAGAAIGIALLAIGMVFVVRQTRRPELSTSS